MDLGLDIMTFGSWPLPNWIRIFLTWPCKRSGSHTWPTVGAILSNVPPTLCTSFVGRPQLIVTWALRLAMSGGVRRRRVRGSRARPLAARRPRSHDGRRRLRRHMCLHSMSYGQCLLHILPKVRIRTQYQAMFGIGLHQDVRVVNQDRCP